MKYEKAIVVLALLITITASYLLYTGEGLSVIEGVNTLSLTRVDLQSNYAPLDGEQVWAYHFTTGGLGQVMHANIDPNQVARKYNGDELPIKTITLDATQEDVCVYKIHPDYSKTWVSEFRITDVKDAFTQKGCREKAEAACGTDEMVMLWQKTKAIGYDCAGICEIGEHSVIGDISNPSITSFVTVSVKNSDGEKEQAAFDTLNGDRVQTIAGDDVFISYAGSFTSGRSCDSQANYRAAYVGGQWRVISEDNYNAYLRSRDNLLDPNNGDSYETVKNRIIETNNRARAAVVRYDFATDGSTIIKNSREATGGIINIRPSKNILVPSFVAYMKASWIGIETPIGEPAIINANSECFRASDDGEIVVTIKNKGDQRGNFDVYALCDNGFHTNNNEVTLDPGDTTTVSLLLGIDTNTKTTGICTVYVDSKEKTVSKPVNVCADPQVSCVPGHEMCVDNTIKECNSEGSGHTIIKEECGVQGCVYDGDKPHCAAQQGIGGGTSGGVNKALLITSLAAGLLMTLILFIITRSLFVFRFGWVLALIIALFVGAGTVIVVAWAVKSIIIFFTSLFTIPFN